MLIDTTRIWLENYTPQTETESSNKHRILSLLEQPNITDKFSFIPGHLTASAMVLSPDRQKILLIYHAGFQSWIQPGGHVDSTDNSLLETALREVAEECQIEELSPLLSPPSLLQIDIHKVPPHSKKNQPAHEHYDLRFAFVAKTWKMEAASDAKAAQWITFQEFDQAQSDASVAESVRRLQDLLSTPNTG